jgi:hypothetical protein
MHTVYWTVNVTVEQFAFQHSVLREYMQRIVFSVQSAAWKRAIIKTINEFNHYLPKYSVRINYYCFYNHPFLCRTLYL